MMALIYFYPKTKIFSTQLAGTSTTTFTTKSKQVLQHYYVKQWK